MKCCKCKRPIEKSSILRKYISHENNIYCKTCASSCTSCKKVLISGINIKKKVGTSTYCKTCYNALPCPTCSGCRKKIFDDCFIHTGRFFCTACNDSDICSSCGRPIGRNIFRKPDKSIICFDCSRPAPIDENRAQNILVGIIKNVSEMFGIVIPGNININLVTFERVQELCAWKRLKASGLYSHGDGIYIVPYYSDDFFESILCHEAVHAWQAVNWRSNYDMKTREGMAEFITYRYSAFKGFNDIIRGMEYSMKTRKGSNYTIGLQMFLEMAENKSENHVLDYFRSL